jgi:hypothetical protein
MAVTALIEGRVMAKVKGRPKKPRGEGSQVRIDSDLATMARYLVAQRGGLLSEYLSAILRPVIEKDMKKAGRKIIEGEME